MAEGARLESVFRGNSNVGSNPTLSAIFYFRQNLNSPPPNGRWIRLPPDAGLIGSAADRLSVRSSAYRSRVGIPPLHTDTCRTLTEGDRYRQ